MLKNEIETLFFLINSGTIDLRIIDIFIDKINKLNKRQEIKELNDYDQILKETSERDYQDSHRELSPLKQAEDAIFLDTSDMTVEENIDAVAEIIIKKIKNSYI